MQKEPTDCRCSLNEQYTRKSTRTWTNDVLHCLTGGLKNWLVFASYPLEDQCAQLSERLVWRSWVEHRIYSLVPYVCNAITLAANALTIHKVGAGRPLMDVLSKFMQTNFHSISLRSKPGHLQRNEQIHDNSFQVGKIISLKIISEDRELQNLAPNVNIITFYTKKPELYHRYFNFLSLPNKWYPE